MLYDISWLVRLAWLSRLADWPRAPARAPRRPQAEVPVLLLLLIIIMIMMIIITIIVIIAILSDRQRFGPS